MEIRQRKRDRQAAGGQGGEESSNSVEDDHQGQKGKLINNGDAAINPSSVEVTPASVKPHRPTALPPLRDDLDQICLYLKLIVMLDFIGVSVLVPLLPAYLSRAGCGNEQLAFISSAYSLAQLIGGVSLGWVSDGLVSRKTILMISLIGSALSYGMVGISHSKTWLILSRIVVGLVKQTMTMTTAYISDLPMDRSRRTKHQSQIMAAVTIAWIVGPAVGGFLYHYSPLMPPFVAASVFSIAAIICLVCVPDTPSNDTSIPELSPRTPREKKPKNMTETLSTFKSNLDEILDDPTTIRIVSIRLLYSFLITSLMPTNFVGYLEARYGLKSHEVAYLHSYRATLSFLAQTFLISAVVKHHAFSEEATARMAILAGVLLKGAEVLNRNRLVFLFGTTPLVVAIFSLFDSSLQGIYTDSIPPGYKGAALGSMSALQSLVKVAAPLYGGEIFHLVGHERRPEIIFWHYVLLSVVVWSLFPPGWRRPMTARREESLKKEQELLAAGVGECSEQLASGSGVDVRNGFAYATIHGTDKNGEIVMIGPQPSKAPPVIRRVRDRWERGSRVKIA